MSNDHNDTEIQVWEKTLGSTHALHKKIKMKIKTKKNII